MKIKLMFVLIALVGTMSSFTSKLIVSGGLKVKVELPSGVVADLEGTPVELFKTKEDAENSKSVKGGFTNAAGEVTLQGVTAGNYFIDAMVETDEGEVYYSLQEVKIEDGKITPFVLKLVRDEEMEGDLEDE